VQRACRLIARAATDGAELAVLPEMFRCEYFSHYRYMDYPELDTGYTTSRIRASERSLESATFSAVARVFSTPHTPAAS
jgi:predicted amidohydrolase